MTRWSIRFSDGTYGPLVSEDAAVKAFDAIDPERRPLCALTCWEEVTEATAETVRPSAPVEPEPIDLHCKHCGQLERYHGHAGYSRPCNIAYRNHYEPINPGPREPQPTLDESEAR